MYARADCPLHRALVPAGRSFVPSTGTRPDAGTASSGAGWCSAAAAAGGALGTGAATAGATTGLGSSTSASSSIAPGSQQQQQEQQQQSGCLSSSYEYLAGGATGSAGACAGLSGACLANLAPLNAAAYPQSAAPFQTQPYYQSPAVGSSFLDTHAFTSTAVPPSALLPASNQQLFKIEQQNIRMLYAYSSVLLCTSRMCLILM